MKAPGMQPVGNRSVQQHHMSQPQSTPAQTFQLDALLERVRACTLCQGLPLGPRPLLQAGSSARILIAGQAPGRRAHLSGVPFDDVSGERLRAWLGLTREQFYDARRVAIIPMGLCFPGTGKSGDLPPRPECAPTWRTPLLEQLPQIALTVVLGRYALAWHCPEQARAMLSDAVAAWLKAPGPVIPLPHPSPRNMAWLKRHPWFEAEVLPLLRERIQLALNMPGSA